MKPIRQTHDFCTCIGGYTLPKYALYGNVYGTTYYCISPFPNTTADGRNTYEIYVFCESRKRPGTGYFQRTNTAHCKNGGAIYVRIRDFVNSTEFRNEPVVRCEHRVWNAEQDRIAAERAERDHLRSVKKWERENMCDAPRLRKVNYNYVPDRMTYYELSVKNGKNVNDFPFTGDGEMRHDTIDHVKLHVSKYRPTDERPQISGYVPNDGTLKTARIEKILNGDLEELYYYTRNERVLDSKVAKFIDERFGSYEAYKRMYSTSKYDR